MEKTIVVGIDAGKKGALAYVKDNVLTVANMPNSIQGVHLWIQELLNLAVMFETYDILIVMEKVNLRPSDLKGGRAFNLQVMLKSYNQIQTILAINGLENKTVEVMPHVWQNYLKVPKVPKEVPEKKKYSVRKQILRSEAEKYSRVQKITIQKADAVLLCVFGLENLKYNREWIIEKQNEKKV